MENTQTWIELGNLYRKLNLAGKALEVFENLFSQGDTSPELLSNLFEVSIECDKADSAIFVSDQYLNVITNSSEKAKTYFTLGKLHMKKNDLQTALKNFNLALELEPSLASQMGNLGMDNPPVLVDEFEMVEALPATKEPTETSEADREEENKEGIRLTMLLTMGIMHWRNGQLEEAEEILTQAIKDANESGNSWIEALAWHSSALVKTALGDVKGAIDAYLKAAELAPNQIFPWNKVGALYENLDMNDEAQEAYQKSLILNPEDSESWNGMGDLLTKHGKLDEAIACYQLGNVFETHSYGNDGIKVYQKALDYYRMTIEEMRMDQADRSLSKSISLESNEPEIQAVLSDLIADAQSQDQELVSEGHDVTALITAEHIEEHPTQVVPQLAEKIEQKNTESNIDENLLRSIKKFEQTVKENPFNDRAWDSLGNLYKLTRMYEKAIFAYENAVAIQPRKHIYHYQLGTLYAAYGNFNVAISEMLKVLEQDPTSTYAHCALANYFRRLGMTEKAKYHIEFAVPFMKNEKEYDRACFESVRGEVDLAFELLEKALDKKQTSIELAITDMDLDFIKSDPRFEQLESKYAEVAVYS